MAVVKIKTGEDYALKLAKLGAASEETAIKAVYAGAAIVADEIRKRLAVMPHEKYRFLRVGDKLFDGLSNTQRKDLLDGFGLTKIDQDKDGNFNTKAGFHGYGSEPSKKYPKGLPNALLARSVESGSSVRNAKPFVRPAVNAVRKKAVAAMEEIIDAQTTKIMNHK